MSLPFDFARTRASARSIVRRSIVLGLALVLLGPLLGPAPSEASNDQSQLDQTRKMWVDMAKNPSAKSTMEGTCKQTMDAIKTSLQSFGCSF